MSAQETAEALLIVIKRIAKWFFFGALAIAAIVASPFGGRLLLDEYEARPQLVTSIGNVALGDRLADVLFREPDFVQEIDYEALAKKHGGVTTVPAGTDPPAFDFKSYLAESAIRFREVSAFLSSDGDDSSVSRLAYESKISSRWIKINDAGQVVRIGYICKDSSQRMGIGGVPCDGRGEHILSRFEGAVKVQCIRDKSDPNQIRYRVYDVERFGVRFHLVSNRVAAFEIMAPAMLAAATGVKWGACE
jgi:hypothetical protein